MRQLLEAGVHFGHQTHRWNPRMKPYIYGDRSGIHIMDLSKTVPALHQALLFVRDTVAKGGRVLFVGTKRQAQEPVAEAAQRCAQYYMNHRWLGGTLTNWSTVSNSIKQLGIPVVAVLDTNCDPADADYGFPGNDDAARAISLYCNLFADAVLDGLAESSAGLGVDLGELEDVAGVVDGDVAAADETADEAGA